jgi:parvulin-like peptidyl-prolyl isomerase
MRNLACLVLLALLALASVARPVEAAPDEVIDRVLAVVSGEVITLSDVRAARELGRVTATDAPDPVRAVLSQLIDRALVLDEVNRFAPPEPSPSAIDEALEAVVARAASAAAFDALLAKLGIDRPFVRDLLREDLRIRAYLDQRFTADTIEQQRAMVNSWISGLRRRADIVDLYKNERTPR